MKKPVIARDKYFWFIVLLIAIITFLHYSNYMAEWELHIFYRKLYYIPIILAAFRYRLRGGLLSSIGVSILYAPHLFLFPQGFNITVLNQYLEIILFISIGFITGRLVNLDFKKQKLLENKVVEITRLQNYTKNIVDSIENVVISIDNRYIVTSVNRAGTKLLGIDNKAQVKITEIISNKTLIDILLQVKVERKPVTDTMLVVELHDTKLYLSINVFPLFDILDRVHGLVLVIEDKSREKHLEAQAIRADRLESLGELASGIAHEIRNPIGIIKTISQVMQSETNNHEIKEGLEIIETEVDRANKVIQELLNYARPQSNIIKSLSLNSLLEETLLIIKKYAMKQEVTINIDLANDVTIFGDKEKLKQVIINILINSVQAIEKAGFINIKTMVVNDWVNIEFKDSGKGIKKEDLNKVFNPFFTTKEKGTGLGMSISNRIIQDHNGFISIDSELGKGTKVDIYLPLKTVEGDKSEK